jgi:hypothetical protein
VKTAQELLDRAAELRKQATAGGRQDTVWALIALAEESELRAKELGEASPWEVL